MVVLMPTRTICPARAGARNFDCTSTRGIEKRCESSSDCRERPSDANSSSSASSNQRRKLGNHTTPAASVSDQWTFLRIWKNALT